MIFVARERHIQETDRTQVPRTTRIHRIPTTFAFLDVGIVFHTTRSVHDRVATIGERVIELADVGAVRLSLIENHESPVHCRGP